MVIRGNKFINIAGKKFGRLTAIEVSCKNKSGNLRWIFKCDCGKLKEATAALVKTGKIQSCGCLKGEGNNYKHGQGKKKNRTAEYSIWAGMMSRCYNEKEKKNYKDYGGRGIKVCERWHSFANFFQDMGKRPSPKHTIDRFPNNDGNYEPSNCRWASKDQQATNKRSNIWLTYKGVTMLLRDWLIKLKINGGNFYQRKKKGFSHIELLEYYDNKKAA